MKKTFVTIGELLLDVCVFVITTIVLFILGGLLCATVALLVILTPVIAIYYAITDETTLTGSLAEQMETLVGALQRVFQPKTESD